MMRRILVPLDGSAFGEHALPRAIALAKRYDATLDLAHVHEVAALVYLEGVPLIDASVELEGIDIDRGYLGRMLARVSGLGVKAVATLLDGPTISALQRHVAESGADLVVMTTHGRGPIGRAWLGSVADGLAHHTNRPILMIRPSRGADDDARPSLDAPAAPLRRVLVASDGEREGDAIVDAARAVAEEGATIVRLALPAHATARTHAHNVLEAAQRERPDLIALPMHAHGRLGELVFGSVTEQVVHAASVPVLMRSSA